MKELRLRGISDIEAGNAYLPEFRQDFNRRFAVVPRSSHNAHRPLRKSDHLERILTYQETRTLSKNLTVQFKQVIYQIQSERPAYSLHKAQVTVCENPQGEVTIFYNKYGHRELNAAAVAQPLSKKQGDELWDAAHHLADNRKNNGLIDKNNYGVTGDNNMVCSEAARWVVMRAKGRYMPETDNKAEKAVGIKFSPQDFYDHEQYFVVTPLSAERAAAGQRGEK